MQEINKKLAASVTTFALVLEFLKNAGDIPGAYEGTVATTRTRDSHRGVTPHVAAANVGAFAQNVVSPFTATWTGLVASLAGWYLVWP